MWPTLDSAAVIASMSCFSLRSEVWMVPLVAYTDHRNLLFDQPSDVKPSEPCFQFHWDVWCLKHLHTLR